MLTGIFGQGIGSALGCYNHLGGLGAQAQAAQQAYPNQQQYAQAQAMSAHQMGNTYRPYPTPQWMFNGQVMTLEEFATAMFGEVSPEKTMFLLKYTKEN